MCSIVFVSCIGSVVNVVVCVMMLSGRMNNVSVIVVFSFFVCLSVCVVVFVIV